MSSETPPPRRIEFHLEGDPNDDGLVLAQDLVTFLSSVLTVFRRLEVERGRKPTTTYRIVDLEFGSATLTLEPGAVDDFDTGSLVSDFLRGAAAVRDKSIDRQRFEPETRKAFLKLLAPVKNRHLHSVNIRADSLDVELRGESRETLRIAAGFDVHAVGQMSGYIDAINVHSDPVFFLYPELGPSRVRCVFDPVFMDTVRSALKRFVTVVGLLEYQEGSPFASRITVDSIEIHPREIDLPTVDQLRGSVPMLTGALDSVSYVRRYRDGEE